MLDFFDRSPRLSSVIDDYLVSPDFVILAEATKAKHRLLYGRLRKLLGNQRAGSIDHKQIAQLMVDWSDRPGMANNMLDRLRSRFRDLLRRRIIDRDPTDGIPHLPIGTIHTWTDDELAQFEERWPRGSDEPFRYSTPWHGFHFTVTGAVVRLAYDLMLHTDQRRSDVVSMAWADIIGNCLFVRQQKTGKELRLPVHGQLLDALSHFRRGNGMILLNERGNAFSPDELSNLMAAAIKAAGLLPRCKPHGLRKACLRRMAERGATAHQLQAVSGHTDLRNLAVYTAAADQQRLAFSAFSLLNSDNPHEHAAGLVRAVIAKAERADGRKT